MNSFRFPLKRVLDWRRTQLGIQEARYKQQAAALAALDGLRAEIEAEGIRAERFPAKPDRMKCSGYDFRLLCPSAAV